MYFLRSVSVVLGLSLPIFASPAGKDVTFKSSIIEKLNNPPAGWIKDERIKVDKDVEIVKLRIHLVQSSMEKFHALATQVRQQPPSSTHNF